MREAVIAAASSSKPEPELISSHFHNNVLACCLDPDLWDPKEAVAFDAISTAGRASSHAGKKHVLTCRVLRIVSHLDMDVFFAAVEERDNPSLNGLPVVGGADPRGGRAGGASTASYRAREYGIHSALPISKAWRLSESARKRGGLPVAFFPVRMERYAEVSAHVMETLRRFIFLVEQVSIDEAYFDLSSCESYTFAEEICRKIKATIRQEERLTASVGIGPKTEAELTKIGVKTIKTMRRF